MKLLALIVLKYLSPHFIHSLMICLSPPYLALHSRMPASLLFQQISASLLPAKVGIPSPGKAPEKPLTLPQMNTLLNVCSETPRNALFPNSKPKQNKPLSFHFQCLL